MGKNAGPWAGVPADQRQDVAAWLHERIAEMKPDRAFIRKEHGHDLIAALESLHALIGGVDDGFGRGVEAAARLIESHCCVSSCCDAQPSAGEAAELAKCVRKNAKDAGA